MLMGRLPGSLPANGYRHPAMPAIPAALGGAQRFAGVPLQPYALPQPVPLPPVAPPAAFALPPHIEAWRAQLLAMNPLILSRRFGLSPAQFRQMLDDPQTAMALYERMQGQGRRSFAPAQFGGGGEGGNSDVAGMKAADHLRSGIADLTAENVLKAFDFGGGLMGIKGLLGTAVQGIGHLAFPDLVGSPAPDFAGYADIGTLAKQFPDLAAAIRALENEMIPANVHAKRAAVLREARKAAAIGRSPGAGAEGHKQGKSSGPGPGNRGPRGGGAYGGMGGVGSHGV
jgi:hypothetical protein